jgi:hypothetical protein
VFVQNSALGTCHLLSNIATPTTTACNSTTPSITPFHVLQDNRDASSSARSTETERNAPTTEPIPSVSPVVMPSETPSPLSPLQPSLRVPVRVPSKHSMTAHCALSGDSLPFCPVYTVPTVELHAVSVPFQAHAPVEAASVSVDTLQCVPVEASLSTENVPIEAQQHVSVEARGPNEAVPIEAPVLSVKAPFVSVGAPPLNAQADAWAPLKVASRVYDELDPLVHQATQLYNSCANWEQLVPLLRGDRGDFHPNVAQVPHRAAHLLNRLRISGAPVTTSTSPCSQQRKLAALLRGPHQSAHMNIPFLQTEFLDMIHKGQWVLLTASLVINEPNLQLSPLGVVPQQDRRPYHQLLYLLLGQC